METILIVGIISASVTLIVSIATIRFNFKLKQLESRIETNKRIQIHEMELLIESYKLIWQNLIELESVIDDEFIVQIKLLLNNKEPIRLKRILETSNKIRVEMLFLPDDLFIETEDLVLKLTGNVDLYIDKIAEIATQGKVEKTDAYKQELTAIHSKTIDDYKNGIKNLRKLFRDSIEKTMFN